MRTRSSLRRTHPKLREIAALGGLGVVLIATYYAFEWEMARELLGRGYDRGSVHWERARGIGLAWGSSFVAPGLVVYVAVTFVAWRRTPIFSAARLTGLHAVAGAAMLIGVKVAGAFGLTAGAALGPLAAYIVLRRGGGQRAIKRMA